MNTKPNFQFKAPTKDGEMHTHGEPGWMSVWSCPAKTEDEAKAMWKAFVESKSGTPGAEFWASYYSRWQEAGEITRNVPVYQKPDVGLKVIAKVKTKIEEDEDRPYDTIPQEAPKVKKEKIMKEKAVREPKEPTEGTKLTLKAVAKALAVGETKVTIEGANGIIKMIPAEGEAVTLPINRVSAWTLQEYLDFAAGMIA